MRTQDLKVCKANKVVDAGYRLNLNEMRVVLACIGQVDSTKELLVADEFELSAVDFAKIFSVSENNAYHALTDVAQSLFNRYIVIDNPYPDRPKVKRLEMRWISSIEYMPDDGKIILCFSKRILPFLGEIRNSFTLYKLEYIGKMTCIYAIRLYELLAQWQSTRKMEVEISWLKKQFQLDEGYNRIFDLKKRVIEPAIKDINEHSNFKVTWEQRKTGRQVTHFIFTFEEKKPVHEKAPKTSSPPRKEKEAPKESPVKESPIKERTIFGVPMSEIEAKARPGESWQQAASRIAKERAKSEYTQSENTKTEKKTSPPSSPFRRLKETP